MWNNFSEIHHHITTCVFHSLVHNRPLHYSKWIAVVLEQRDSFISLGNRKYNSDEAGAKIMKHVLYKNKTTFDDALQLL